MNHTQILKRAWQILWSYRTLWVFGVILVLTTGRPDNNITYQLSDQDFNNGRPFITPPDEVKEEFQSMLRALQAFISPERLNTIIGIIVALICLGIIIGIIFTIAKYVSKVALIRMVDHYEITTEKVSVKQGFRLGWSRLAWRLFLIDLLIYLPLALVIIALFGCAALPLASSMLSGQEPGIASIVTMIGAFFLVIFLIIIAGVLLSLVMEIIRRVCVLKESGVISSIQQGVILVRHHFKDVTFLWLILLGISIVFMIALIPMIFLLLGIGAVVGGGIGYLIYAVWGVAGHTATLLSSIGVGLAFFFMILIPPLILLGGWRETYMSTAWTLAYRELQLSEGNVQEDIPHDENNSET